MRDRTEYLLACLGEECGELQQVVGKAIRFGIYNTNIHNTSNVLPLIAEFHDIVAVYQMLCEHLSLPQEIDEQKLETKKGKVNLYFGEEFYKGKRPQQWT